MVDEKGAGPDYIAQKAIEAFGLLQQLGIWAIEHPGLFGWSRQKPQSPCIADDSASKAVAAFGRFLLCRRGTAVATAFGSSGFALGG